MLDWNEKSPAQSDSWPVITFHWIWSNTVHLQRPVYFHINIKHYYERQVDLRKNTEAKIYRELEIQLKYPALQVKDLP